MNTKINKIVKDSKYPGMFRVEWEDGVLSVDMYNHTRATEHLRTFGIEQEKLQESDPEVPRRMPRIRPRKLTGALFWK